MDIIVTNYPNSALTGMGTPRILREFWDVFVANREFFPLEQEVLTLGRLKSYPILMLDSKSTTSQFLHSMFRRCGLDLVPEIELSSNDLLIDLARIGLGIAFVPDFCIPPGEKDLFVLQLQEAFPARHMVAVYNESLPLSRAVKQFMEILLEDK